MQYAIPVEVILCSETGQGKRARDLRISAHSSVSQHRETLTRHHCFAASRPEARGRTWLYSTGGGNPFCFQTPLSLIFNLGW